MKIAMVGKGGSGKTTLAGTLARVLARRRHRVLAIDGDPNLALTLGMSRLDAATAIASTPGRSGAGVEHTRVSLWREPTMQPVLPDLSGLDPHALRDYFADTHYATPIRALSLLEHMGRLPPQIAIIGCEPAEHEELGIGLSAPVAAALDQAVRMAHDWVEKSR